MNTEQQRADFEAWATSQWLVLQRTVHGEDYQDLRTQVAWEAYQAGRAALQSQDREDAAMAETLREAAEIIFAIQPEHAPENIRWPIVDELHGFASMIDHARRIEGDWE